MSAERPEIAVVGAVILRGDRVLCAQRLPGGDTGGQWEFPGGKIERGESPRAALEREITEELGCRVRAGDDVTTTRHEYPGAAVTLTTYLCELVSGVPRPSEHAQLMWADADAVAGLDWAPADVPAVAIVRALLYASRREPATPSPLPHS